MIQILEKTFWSFGRGNLPGQGLTGQVTKCSHAGVIFYVRENINAIGSFQISSGERWGDKIGRKPRKERQSLELFAPADHWDRLAAIVNDLDPLHRPVLRNRAFNDQFIKIVFSNQSSGSKYVRW